ncbi:radical SAM family heme chaperone HemW [Algoriphagus aestuarii]|nr:radical SAM family heme chaperone HemW [Algoriphagus aestuarii]
MAGIYIHIPFCKQACHYCDFHFSTNLNRMEEMVTQIKRELLLRKDYLQGASVETVYFGGGTPSLLKPKMIESILDTIQKQFPTDWKEVTLEANPDDLSQENLIAWKSLGVDRLSLGIQSFNQEVLYFYNRAHTATESKLAINQARQIGFEKFSMDLIYGYPHPDHSIWQNDLQEAISLNPGHISSYALTVEPKTALGKWEQSGKFKAPDEDFVSEQFEMLQGMSENAGYIQYEISNFGKPEQFALHNTNYWKGIPYLGVGPSAHSFDGDDRGANPRNNSTYLNTLASGSVPFEVEKLEKEDLLNEYILTGLRTIWGIDLDSIRRKYGFSIPEEKKAILEQMNQQGWLIWEHNRLSLSKKGKLLADSIAAALFK